MRKHLLFAVAFLIYLSGYAQERTISGKVTSVSDGTAAPGVNIIVKGTTSGTTTDNDGNYRLALPEGKTVVVFSFIGFKTTEIDVANRTTVDVQLETDATQLSEVIVVGYGTQVKQDLTGNIASVSGKDVQAVPVQSFDQAIQGRAAGVFIEAGNGKLGQGVKVRVRGAASVSASNEPLYVVDGIIITSDNLSSTSSPTNPLANINSSDIESIQILKDAAASAIYGSRAANGVIIITTKRGKNGKTSFNVNYMKGFSSPTRKAKWLDGPQYYEAFKEAFDNTDAILQRDEGTDFGDYMYGEPGLTFDGVLDYELGDWNKTTNVNWADKAYQSDAGIDQLDLSASGGNEKTKFYTSLLFNDQKGILILDRYKKISGRANIDHKANDKLSFGVNFSLSRSINNRLSNDNEFTTPMQMLALPPIQPDRLENGELSTNTLYFNGLIKAENSSFETTVLRNISNVYAAYQIIPSLSFRSEFGIDILTQNEDMWNGRAVDSQTNNINGGVFASWTEVFNYSTNNYLTFFKQNDVHSIEVVGGMSFQRSNITQTTASAQTFPNDAFKTLTATSVITDVGGVPTDYSFLSYFARANYKLKDRYLLSLSGRMDGSSKFGQDERYGFFPAASVGWIMTKEGFLADQNTVSFLKIRASYGLTGNAPTQNFAGLPLYAPITYQTQGGVTASQLANRNLKWENTTQTDIGIDFGILNDRITGELDYYVKNTTDLLLNSNVPGTSGFLTQYLNVGELQNKGFEIVINSQNIVGDFSWSTSFNFARNRNKVTNLSDNVIEDGYLNRAVEGYPLGVFYGKEFAGVDPANGDALFYVNDPNNPEDRSTTNDYDAAGRRVIGNPNPDFIGGLTNNLSYKGFDLNFLFQFVYGNDVYNGGGKFQRGNFAYFDNQLVTDYERAWRNPGDNTVVPESRLFLDNGDQESSRFLQDASYLRLKTVTLGYNFPKSFISRAKLESLRLYVSGLNLLTFTNYDLNDPEVNTDYLSSNISQGNDFYAAPQIKTVSFGINIGF